MSGFEWDADKAELNRRKHGVSFKEAVSVFSNPLSATYDDPDHSNGEQRYLTIGTSQSGRLLIVSHTDRGDNIRIIGAREATRREHIRYEEDP
jgi:uncharacterized DUF497 family protein